MAARGLLPCLLLLLAGLPWLHRPPRLRALAHARAPAPFPTTGCRSCCGFPASSAMPDEDTSEVRAGTSAPSDTGDIFGRIAQAMGGSDKTQLDSAVRITRLSRQRAGPAPCRFRSNFRQETNTLIGRRQPSCLSTPLLSEKSSWFVG